MNEITTRELKILIDQNKKFILLDCRGVDYFNWEHLPRAINLRWKFVKDRAEKLLPNKKALIITSCDGFTCSASIRCFENLASLGYTNLIEYSGGIADWKAHNLKTVEEKEFKITSNIYRFPNQEFAGESVGSYLVEEEDFILLIDGPQQLSEEHQDFILHFNKPIKVFMTHDPTAGESKILQKKYKAKIYLHQKDKNGSWLNVKPDFLVDDGYKFASHLTVIHTPGHTPGSSVLFDSKNKILFSGDHLEGNVGGELRKLSGSRANTNLMLKSAKKLLKYDFEQILPFHYQMIRNNAKNKLINLLKNYENSNN